MLGSGVGQRISVWRPVASGALTTAEATLRRAHELAGEQPQSTLDESLVELLTLAGQTQEAFAAGARMLGVCAMTRPGWLGRT